MAYTDKTPTLKENLAQIARDYQNGWITLTECYNKTIDDTVKWYQEAMGADSCPLEVTDDALRFVNAIIMGNADDTETAE